MRENCCLSCVLVPLRPATTSSPTVTQPPTTTQPSPTTQPLECKQEFQPETCELLLSSGMSCSHEDIVRKCCDYACLSTTVPTTQPDTTTVITTTSVPTDPVPDCFIPDKAQTCSNFVNPVPSGCYQESVYKDCCSSCSEFYYDRKGSGYNVEMCSYGNRDAACTADVDCSIVEEARKCCDICYPKMDIPQRPIPTALTADYVFTLAIDDPCLSFYQDPLSIAYSQYSNLIVYSMRTIMSVLPGTQAYSVSSITCDAAAADDVPIQIVVTMITPPTHTFAELKELFETETASGELGLFTINTAMSEFVQKEFYDAQCVEDVSENCEVLAHDSACYFSAAFDGCCVSCHQKGVMLFENRTYVPKDCEYGDKDTSCNENVDCSTADAMEKCCYTCAPKAIDYTLPPPMTTTPASTTSTSTQQPQSTAAPTTTRQPCVADTSDRCNNLTKPIRSCYNDELVYEPCCKSCDLAALWYLPDSCAWGDREPWCEGITPAQCSESNFNEACCETCGPRVTTTSTTQPTTSTMPTTTSPCVDDRNDCSSLIVTASSCYDWESECCATCADRVLDYLNYTCRYGDLEEACASQELSICAVSAFAAQCCKLCGPPEPSTTGAAVSTSTTTMSTTSDPGCVGDANSDCNLRVTDGGCYNDDVLDVCCLTCEGLYDANAAVNCRYGDRKDYCSGVTRERCLTEARVYTDCCKTCEGLVAPPGVCVDTVSNCAALTTEDAACYSDLIYSQCCDTCEEKAQDNLGPTCKWGDSKVFCSSYAKDDCSSIAMLNEECCALCSEEITTTPLPTTTTQPQCVDSPLSNCVQDTAEKRFCYESGVVDDCCASCSLLADNNKPSCLYGDKADWCSLFENFNRCDEPYIRDHCCELCAPPTTTPMPTTSACYDTGNCTDPVSECYEDRYEAICCATCRAAYNVDALFGCEYGDKDPYCQFVNKEQCLISSQVREDCCMTCPILTAVTTTTGSTTTTQPTTTTTGPSTTTPECTDSDVNVCRSVQDFNCYSVGIREACCATCATFETDEESCLYGDKDGSYCSGNIDCSLSVTRELCCDTCAGYVIPNGVEAMYQLTVSVTNVKCTVGLNDKGSSQYLVFKYNMEQLVDSLLVDVPGLQVSELVNLTCGSVLAILEIRSAGFYDLRELNKVIMDALTTGTLGQYAVSTVGSSLKALSFQVPQEFEPPNCMSGDFSLNCLTDFVTTRPSRCSEPEVRSQCCESCSSLFYSRLSAGVDISSCPYGDRDSECFTSAFIDCQDEEARTRCCDRCAGVTTPPPPTTSTTSTTTPPPTTTICVDSDPDLCARAVGNSLTYCYLEEAADCCATCAAKKIPWLPEDCAWGDREEFCANRNESSCLQPNINASCCKLCGDNGVDPSTPCSVPDTPGFDCSLIPSSPALCYKSENYDNCCQTCNSVYMDYLPQGCKWGDREGFCDSSDKICSAYGERLCCGSCCSDCIPPATEPTTTAITTPAATTSAGPPGCSGDAPSADCANLITEPMDCYSTAVADLCCESCYNMRMTELPDTCQYGDKLSSCVNVTYADCALVGSACCGSCYNLLDSICNDTAETGVSNCEQTVARAGTCYSKDTTKQCCSSCKEIVDFSLPFECRFGDKVSWCGDITDANRDRICSQEDSQQQCCKTCSEYVARTVPPTTTTTTLPTTTRLQPNEQCPLGDIVSDCTNRTAEVGACYNPIVSENCCRTCYEQWQEDLPSNCRYGDKSTFCRSTPDDQVDYEWCLMHGETCCARCLTYLTTTVPTTTQLAACPQGNIRNDCDILVQSQHDCNSPVRAEGCCVHCNQYIKPNLPSSCKYGDKARFCEDIQDDECDEHSETCCERCGYNVTTVPTTVRSINRPSVVIGRGLFNRPEPPMNIALFRVSFSMAESCQIDDLDLADHDSDKFKLKQNEVCGGMSGKMWSMTHCYVHSTVCTNGNRTSYIVYVLVDRSLNYDDVDDVTSFKITSELADVEYSDLLTTDVNECETQNDLLQDGCHDQATCTNTEGLYSCTCLSSASGNGFDCLTTIDPAIGRDSFTRTAPPADQHLYGLQLQIDSTNGQAHSCFSGMDDPSSDAFKEMESKICTALSDTMLSLHSCYVSDFDCSDDMFKVNVYILVDASVNYQGKQVTEEVIKEELDDYDGVIVSSVVEDVNECTTQVEKLAHSCDESATCGNSVGLYTCTCIGGLSGDGFECRPVVTIGRDLFLRPTPPGEIALFKITFSQASSCQVGDAELQNVQSNKFGIKQNEICEEMSGKLLSMENCYVHSMTCTNGDTMPYVAYVLINRMFNYDSVGEVTKIKLTTELESGSGQIYDSLLVDDVNECETDITLLQDRCHSQASCTNTEGLYSCTCPSSASGNGFDCVTRIEPSIGRDSFIRSAPPGYQYLYRLQLQIDSTDGYAHDCFEGISDPFSVGFLTEESRICRALSDTMLSLHSCYVSDFDCSNDMFKVNVYILVDASINYQGKQVTEGVIRSELDSYNGDLESIVVQDVNECTTQVDELKHSCHQSATCANSVGLYTCACNAGLSGSGFICRPIAVVGRDLFNRPAPPGDIALFKVTFSQDESCQVGDAELQNVQSTKFGLKQNEICEDMSGKLLSMENCYVHSMTCTNGNTMSYVAYVLINRMFNYDSVEKVTSSELTNELTSSQSRRKRSVTYNSLFITDVNECTTDVPLLQDGCDSQASCANTEGLYSCTCPASMSGNGFDCLARIDPNIGRDSFIRSVPPGHQYLYRLQLQISSTDGYVHSCFTGIDEMNSDAYKAEESRICRVLSETMLSLHSCYVSDFDCSNSMFKVNAYILVDASINYEDKKVTSGIIKSELDNYNGEMTSSLVRDVDECTTDIVRLEDACHQSATCTNSDGLYMCTCNSGLNGDGFSCRNDSVTDSSYVGTPRLEDWAIALIVVGAVVALVAIVVLIVCCCHYGRRKPENHEQLTTGEETPPRQASSLPPFYNSLRSTKAPPSEYGGSFFYPNQEQMPGYAMKTYNVASHVGETENDTAVFRFED